MRPVYGQKIVYSGLALMFAINPIIEMFGGKGNDIIVTVGACFLAIGAIVCWFDR